VEGLCFFLLTLEVAWEAVVGVGRGPEGGSEGTIFAVAREVWTMESEVEEGFDEEAAAVAEGTKLTVVCNPLIVDGVAKCDGAGEGFDGTAGTGRLEDVEAAVVKYEDNATEDIGALEDIDIGGHVEEDAEGPGALGVTLQCLM
jgi:hypothetical protein